MSFADSINITLVSDFDQLRDHWVKKPLDYLTATHMSDAQVNAALRYLKEQIQKDPRPVPKAPPYPNKAFQYDK